MDPIPAAMFILMVLFHLTNQISGASLGNVELFNETFDAENEHRTVLQNIQRNYADDFSNYEMADIENFLSGFMTPVQKEKSPIYTSKTFFGSDQFFGVRERSKDDSQHQTWDPFRANRVIGSQPSYFDVPDDLFQDYIYSKNNHESSYSKTGGDNPSELPRGMEDLAENKDDIPLRHKDEGVEELSHSEDGDAEDEEVEELSHPEDGDAEDEEVEELSHPEDGDAEDEEVEELSQPEDGDAEDEEVEGLSQPEDGDAEDEEVEELLQPEDGDAEEVEELLQPEDGDAEDEMDAEEVSSDGTDQTGKLSETVDSKELGVLIVPIDNGAENEPVGEHEGQTTEFSHPIEVHGHGDEFIHLVDKTQSQMEDISHPGDGNQVHGLFTSEKGVFDSKDSHIEDVTPENVFSRMPHSSMAGVDVELLELGVDSSQSQDVSFQTVEGNSSESMEDKLISFGNDVDSELFRVDKLTPTKVIEDLKHLKINTKIPLENPGNNANILPLDEKNDNKSRFSKIRNENLEKVQSINDFDLTELAEKTSHEVLVPKEGNDHPDKIDIDEFQGSGDSFDNSLASSLLESKSGRIIDVFPRVNDTAECTTPKGERGRCLSLTQCPLSDPLNNFNLFLKYVCLSRGVLVGICCPDNPVVEISDPAENSTGTPVTELKQPIDGCGGNTNTRIVGGKVSLPHEWTWMVALLRRNRFFCGGVIINDWYILTAAHCVMGIKLKDLKVRLGEFNFNEKNEHQEDIPVAEIKRHALFVTLTFQHDIALLKLKRRIEYTKFIGSICLPQPDSGNFTNVNATVVGWGTEAFGGSASPVLRQVTVPVWDNEECDRTYRLERITNAFMCAGSPENGEDACQGDSGGPLMALNEAGRWEVIGIVSWGRRCGDPTFPGVYTRVTSYLDWIKENAI